MFIEWNAILIWRIKLINIVLIKLKAQLVNAIFIGDSNNY